MRDVVDEITRKGMGMACVVDDGRLAGVITDGDLRRHMSRSLSLLERTAQDVMTHNPVTVDRTTLATEVLNIFEQRKITSIVVVDADRRVSGTRLGSA